MQLQVNPHELILIGENSFMRLSTDGGRTASTRCSHWRVLWSPSGPGHALFVDSPVTAGVRIYADSVPLVPFLQTQIECLLYKPFSDTNLPFITAAFARLAAEGRRVIRGRWIAAGNPAPPPASPGARAGFGPGKRLRGSHARSRISR
jgi:hypothetical protein